MSKNFVFTILVMVQLISVSAFAADPSQTQSTSGAGGVELDVQDSTYLLRSSGYHLEADGSVSVRLRWSRQDYTCIGNIGNVEGPGPVRIPPYICYEYRVNLAPVVGLERSGDQVVYTSENGATTVCATISTRTNWLRRRVVTFHATGNCKVLVTRIGHDRVATLVVH